MKQFSMWFLNLFCFILVCISSFAQTNPNHVRVNGYYKSDGTYVKPYFRTAPNQTNRDNFSTRGNVNPYSGKPGWVEPDSKYNTLYHSNYTYPHSPHEVSANQMSPIIQYKDRIYVEDENGNYSCYLKEFDERTFSIFNMKDELIFYLVINHRGDYRIFDPNGIYIKTIFLKE